MTRLGAGMHALRDEMAKDPRTAGMTDDELTPIRGDMGRLASLHGKARLLGREGVRTAEKLLDDVGGVMSRSFNIPAASRSKREFLLEEGARRGFSNDHLTEERRSQSQTPARKERGASLRRLARPAAIGVWTDSGRVWRQHGDPQVAL